MQVCTQVCGNTASIAVLSDVLCVVCGDATAVS